MNYFLTRDAVLRWLERPSVYHVRKDELYELDDEGFDFLQKCAGATGCSSGMNEFVEYCMDEGILTREKTIINRPVLSRAPTPSLRYLELQITEKCNLRCRHCYIGEIGQRELPVPAIRRALEEFEEMQGLRVLITGGEPLLHSKFSEINRMLQDFSIRKLLLTNGLLLSREALRGLNVEEIQISIDGLEEAHESLRGKGTFRKTIDAIRRSIDSGYDVSVSTMIHPGNLKDFDELERLFTGMGVKEWTVDVPCISGRLGSNPELQTAPEIGGKYLRYGYGEGYHSGASGFACGLHLMSVMPDGGVARCTFYSRSPVGNVTEGLRRCWQRLSPIPLDDLLCDCQYLESCRGGCRYRAELLGNPLGRDLYRCAMYGIIGS
jgi:radical SAM protein with 4Fe4S-binding SPASM domain